MARVPARIQGSVRLHMGTEGVSPIQDNSNTIIEVKAPFLVRSISTLNTWSLKSFKNIDEVRRT